MTFPFSNRTIVELARSIEQSHSHTAMDTLFFACSLDTWEDADAPNKLAKAMNLLKAMQIDGLVEASDGARDLMTHVLKVGKPKSVLGQASAWYDQLVGALIADGFEFDELTDSLIPAVKGVSVAAEVTWLEAELRRRGWTAASGHYEQALDNFGRGNWASASAQLRSLYEEAIRTAGGTNEHSGSGQVQAAIDELAGQPGVLMEKEDAFAKALWNVLHKDGSHPGLGDEHLARFRLLAVTGYLRLLLVRLP